MRNRAAALLILTLTTSCSGAPRRDERSATPVAIQHPTTTTIAGAPTTNGPPASTAAPSTSTGGSQPTPPIGATDSLTAATRVVDQLIAGNSDGTVPDVDLWSGVAAGGHVIQTTVLAETANRATVAISIAFDPTPGQAELEPIGLRVELLHYPDSWDVIAIGYL